MYNCYVFPWFCFMFMVSTTPALEADVMRQIHSISAQEHVELSSL